MKGREWFGVGLRAIGVVSLIYGAVYLLNALLFRLGYLNYPESGPDYYLITAFFHLLIGLYLVRGAPLLVNFSYPMEEEDETNGDEEDEERPDSGGS